MHIINLNLERWSLVGELDNDDYYTTTITDIVSLADSISWANIDDIYDIYHEYTH